MPKDKLKTIYVCNQCGETSPPVDGPLPLRGVEYDDRGCSGGTDQKQFPRRSPRPRDRSDEPDAPKAEKHQHHRGEKPHRHRHQ